MDNYHNRANYFKLYEELEKLLYDDWIWYNIPAHKAFDKTDEYIKELCDYAFSAIITHVRITDGIDKLVDLLEQFYKNDGIGNPAGIIFACTKLIEKQEQLRDLYKLAMNEQKTYPLKDIEREKKLSIELDEYLRIGEEIEREGKK